MTNIPETQSEGLGNKSLTGFKNTGTVGSEFELWAEIVPVLTHDQEGGSNMQKEQRVWLAAGSWSQVSLCPSF